jgi:predicted transcriptional regulator
MLKNDFWSTKEIQATSKLLYIYVSNQTQPVVVSRNKLQQSLGFSLLTISKAIKELEENNLFVIQRIPGHESMYSVRELE